MTLSKEVRIFMPFTLEEYGRGLKYTIARTNYEACQNGNGVELLESRYEDDGSHYTKKKYYIAGYLPGWLTSLVSKSSLVLEEESWDMFPHSRTVITAKALLGERFSIEVVSDYVDQDRGTRKEEVPVVSLDIAKDQLADSKYYRAEEDPSIHCSRIFPEIGPLGPGWQAGAIEGMTCYKRVSARCKVLGLSSKIERFIVKFQAQVFLRTHKQIYTWSDHWYAKTMSELIEEEKRYYSRVGEVFRPG